MASGENGDSLEKTSDDEEQEHLNRMNEDVQKLRDLMPLKSVDFKNCDDAFLLDVLQARRFDLDNSFELLCNYFEFREKYSHFFENLTASELRFAVEDGFPCVLPNTDSNGSKIMVLFPGTWDVETFDIDTLLKAVILSLEHLSKSRRVRVNGIVLLVDFSGWTTNHTAKLTIRALRTIVAVFQECSTVWFKNVHLINQPWYVNAFISLTKSFMKDYVHDRVILHGNNLSTLHEFIPQDFLPAEFGGNNPEVDLCYWANLLLEAEKRAQKRASTFRMGKNPLKISIDKAQGRGETSDDSNENEPLLNNLDFPACGSSRSVKANGFL